jgi:hypothetical protein
MQKPHAPVPRPKSEVEVGMGKVNARLEAARRSYREALDAARAKPSPEAWARLLAAGKDLSSAEEPKHARSGRRTRRNTTPTLRDLERGAVVDAEPTDPADAVAMNDGLDPPEPGSVMDSGHQEFEHTD